MRKEENRLLVLCDTEEEYAQLMTEFLRGHRDIPWEIHTYTDVDKLLEEERGQAALLVAAESSYREEMQRMRPLKMIILSEGGLTRRNSSEQDFTGPEEIYSINKYQQAENVLRELLEIYMDIMGEGLSFAGTGCQTRFIGLYSPIRRCMQTSFALTLSQVLSKQYKTLYLNFEHYVGLSELTADAGTKDLADLLYFLTADREKFKLRLQTMVHTDGELTYIPPMKYGQNLLTVTAAEWMNLLQKIAESGDYEYVILDLSESMQGLFDILRLCSRVFTLTREDRISKGKLCQYEQLLMAQAYEDVLEKTRRCRPPHIHRLPETLEQYTKGDLADYVRRQLREIENE